MESSFCFKYQLLLKKKEKSFLFLTKNLLNIRSMKNVKAMLVFG